jgi:hypothetical protein
VRVAARRLLSGWVGGWCAASGGAARWCRRGREGASVVRLGYRKERGGRCDRRKRNKLSSRGGEEARRERDGSSWIGRRRRQGWVAPRAVTEKTAGLRGPGRVRGTVGSKDNREPETVKIVVWDGDAKGGSSCRGSGRSVVTKEALATCPLVDSTVVFKGRWKVEVSGTELINKDGVKDGVRFRTGAGRGSRRGCSKSRVG